MAERKKTLRLIRLFSKDSEKDKEKDKDKEKLRFKKEDKDREKERQREKGKLSLKSSSKNSLNSKSIGVNKVTQSNSSPALGVLVPRDTLGKFSDESLLEDSPSLSPPTPSFPVATPVNSSLVSFSDLSTSLDQSEASRKILKLKSKLKDRKKQIQHLEARLNAAEEKLRHFKVLEPSRSFITRPLRKYCFDLPDSTSSINYLENSETIESATLIKLIEKFTISEEREVRPLEAKKVSLASIERNRTPHKKSSPQDIEEFLNCCSVYTHPAELLDLLLVRYRGPDPDDVQSLLHFQTHKSTIQKKVLQFIEFWLRQRPFDFEDESICRRLELFLSRSNSPDLQSLTNELLLRLNSKADVIQLGEEYRLSKMNPEEVAQQLTLLEFDMMKNIKPDELIHQRWNKEQSSIMAPHVLKAIHWFNTVSMWFNTEILKEETIEDRKTAIVCVIKIGLQCQALNNFNGMMEVLSCVHCQAIESLKQTWELVPSSLVQQLQQIEKLMSPKFNYQKYRMALNTTEAPFVPFLGVFLTDLTYMDDCKEDFVAGTLINLDKVRAVGGKIKDLQRHSSKSYENIKPNPAIQYWICHPVLWQENDLYRISKLREASVSDSSSLQDKGLLKRTHPTNKHLSSGEHDSTSRAKYFGQVDVTGHEKVSAHMLELSDYDWHLLLTSASCSSYPNNHTLFDLNTVNRHLWIIKCGRVRLETGIFEGGELKGFHFQEELSEDALFGEMSTLKTSHASTVRAITVGDDVELLKLEVSVLVDLFQTYPDLAMRFYGSLAVTLACKLRQRVAPTSSVPSPLSPTTTTTTTTTTTSTTSGGSPPGSSPPTTPRNSTPTRENYPQTRKRTFSRTSTIPTLKTDEIILREYPSRMNKKHSGKLILLQTHLQFFAKIDEENWKKLEHVPYSNILRIKKKPPNSLSFSTTSHKRLKFTLQSPEIKDEAFEALTRVWYQATRTPRPPTPLSGSASSTHNHLSIGVSTSFSNSSPVSPLGNSLASNRLNASSPLIETPAPFAIRSRNTLSGDDAYEDPLLKQDWDLILKGAKTVVVTKDHTIIEQGQLFQRLYYLSSGTCRLQRDGVLVGKLTEGEMFGEISFLEANRGATVSVLADEENVRLSIIEGYFVRILCDMVPGFAGRFFHYLCSVLASRLGHMT